MCSYPADRGSLGPIGRWALGREGPSPEGSGGPSRQAPTCSGPTYCGGSPGHLDRIVRPTLSSTRTETGTTSSSRKTSSVATCRAGNEDRTPHGPAPSPESLSTRNPMTLTHRQRCCTAVASPIAGRPSRSPYAARVPEATARTAR